MSGKNKIDAAAARQDDQKKMSFNSSSVVELRFIHQAPTTAKDDELVRISPFESEDGSVKYAWRYIFNNSSANVSILESRSQVRDQLRNLTSLLAWDSDPYETVQLLLPTMPSVLFTAEDFSEAIETVIDSIMGAFRSWPIKVEAKSASAVCQASMPAPQEFVERLEAAAADEEEDEEEEVLPALSGDCCAQKTSCTRSGRCYTPEQQRSRKWDEPPPLVRLSQQESCNRYSCWDTPSRVSRFNPEDEDDEEDEEEAAVRLATGGCCGQKTSCAAQFSPDATFAPLAPTPSYPTPLLERLSQQKRCKGLLGHPSPSFPIQSR